MQSSQLGIFIYENMLDHKINNGVTSIIAISVHPRP